MLTPEPETAATPPESAHTPSDSTPATPADAPADAPEPERRQPRQEIFGNPEDPRNIVTGTRTRRPKPRNEAYTADLANPEQMPAYYAAFALGVNEDKPKIYKKNLLLSSKF